MSGAERPGHARGAGMVTAQRGSSVSGAQLYNTIGATYTVTRRTDPRIAARIWDALGDARTVLNVGPAPAPTSPPAATSPLWNRRRSCGRSARRSGTVRGCRRGEPAVRRPVIRRRDGLSTVITGRTRRRVRETRRVARRVVVLTFDANERRVASPVLAHPRLPARFAGLLAWPPLAEMAAAIRPAEPVLIPWDCTDGLFEAYWRRPGATWTITCAAGIGWTRVGPQAEQRAVRRLSDDLDSGRWAERNRDLVDLDAADLGLRLLVT